MVSYSNCSIFNGTRVEVFFIAKGMVYQGFWSCVFAGMRRRNVGMRAIEMSESLGMGADGM
ncbi:MAG: hypothetical protein P4L35_00875 [Ignavibacteriaceae bacterium]|nr:hypothetical protein [Ignavibacteriaceae bacterium]